MGFIDSHQAILNKVLVSNSEPVGGTKEDRPLEISASHLLMHPYMVGTRQSVYTQEEWFQNAELSQRCCHVKIYVWHMCVRTMRASFGPPQPHLD
jgi:hypothetical protein